MKCKKFLLHLPRASASTGSFSGRKFNKNMNQPHFLFHWVILAALARFSTAAVATGFSATMVITAATTQSLSYPPSQKSSRYSAKNATYCCSGCGAGIVGIVLSLLYLGFDFSPLLIGKRLRGYNRSRGRRRPHPRAATHNTCQKKKTNHQTRYSFHL